MTLDPVSTVTTILKLIPNLLPFDLLAAARVCWTGKGDIDAGGDDVIVAVSRDSRPQFPPLPPPPPLGDVVAAEDGRGAAAADDDVPGINGKTA